MSRNSGWDVAGNGSSSLRADPPTPAVHLRPMDLRPPLHPPLRAPLGGPDVRSLSFILHAFLLLIILYTQLDNRVELPPSPPHPWPRNKTSSPPATTHPKMNRAPRLLRVPVRLPTPPSSDEADLRIQLRPPCVEKGKAGATKLRAGESVRACGLLWSDTRAPHWRARFNF